MTQKIAPAAEPPARRVPGEPFGAPDEGRAEWAARGRHQGKERSNLPTERPVASQVIVREANGRRSRREIRRPGRGPRDKTVRGFDTLSSDYREPGMPRRSPRDTRSQGTNRLWGSSSGC